MAKKIVFLFVCIFLLSACSDSEIEMPESAEVIENFKKAVLMENLGELESSLSPDKDVEIETKYLKQLISYYKEEPKEFDELISLLFAQQSLLDQESNSFQSNELLSTTSPDQILNAGSLYLKKEEGIFSDSYLIGVRPHYIFIKTEPSNANIKIEGKDVHTTTKQGEVFKYGPVMPGIYQIEGSREYPYRKVTEKEEVNFLKENRKSMSIEANLTLKEIKDPKPLMQQLVKHAMYVALEVHNENPDPIRLSEYTGKKCGLKDNEISCNSFGFRVGKQLTYPLTFKPSGVFYVGISKAKDKSKDLHDQLESDLENSAVGVRILVPKGSIIKGTSTSNLLDVELERYSDTKKLFSDYSADNLRHTSYNNLEEAKADLAYLDGVEWFTVQVNSKTDVTIK
ncbi:hypothetical protein SAMN05444392_11215 [Seinonella peptonophila]|uniref:TcaA second domain-containing protein n=1 Tax=Seinonella peptonophila TaxID=112248 RepID=A0A1M5A4W8_9BACL|nr:hypothetical protein [Seinonella peptonophila]SHF25308.1 hypothetical protein SAMN05444392_11215 [Seinonella peptonophila]